MNMVLYWWLFAVFSIVAAETLYWTNLKGWTKAGGDDFAWKAVLKAICLLTGTFFGGILALIGVVVAETPKSALLEFLATLLKAFGVIFLLFAGVVVLTWLNCIVERWVKK
jgi:hypothetical protein